MGFLTEKTAESKQVQTGKDREKGWAFHTAIDRDLVDVDKNAPNAWQEFNFQCDVAELNAGIHDLYIEMRKQARRSKVKEMPASFGRYARPNHVV